MVRPSFKNVSTGIAPVQSLPPTDRKLFLRSTSQESFAGQRHPAPRSCLKYSSQGLGQILYVGQKRTIHAGVPQKVAELAQRSMCEYTSNFREAPLLGASVNRQLAESFRDANRSSQKPAPIPSVKSSYAEAHSVAEACG
ncbi:unnamed protein product [Symbiodinium natans]|uniref:Uncharacterized protein n=1 Tax=Symbiodinium natans TaxID=878477 RepID=A0A812S763_9DINO|nr:unnamed protein product [Symbiodinium natans]